jgi:hypothetical protein
MPSVRRYSCSALKKTSKGKNLSKIVKIETGYNFNNFKCDGILCYVENEYDEKITINENNEEIYKNIYKRHMNYVLNELLYCYYCKCCKSFVGTKYLKFNYCSFICYVHKNNK